MVPVAINPLPASMHSFSSGGISPCGPTSIHRQVHPGDVRRCIRSEKEQRPLKFTRIPRASHWRLRLQPPGKVRIPLQITLRWKRSRADAIDANAISSQMARCIPRELEESRLCRPVIRRTVGSASSINRRIRTDAAIHGRNIDYGSPSLPVARCFTQYRKRALQQLKSTNHIHAINLLEIGGLRRFQRPGRSRAGVVYEHVEAAVRLSDPCHMLSNCALVGDVEAGNRARDPSAGDLLEESLQGSAVSAV